MPQLRLRARAYLGLTLLLVALTTVASDGAELRQVLLSKEVQRENGDAVGVFQLREGDAVGEAVSAFGQSVGLSPGEEASLLANVQKEAVSLRLIPLKSMDVTLPGGRRITSLQIFEGDSIRETVLAAADLQGVTEGPLREELVATVVKVILVAVRPASAKIACTSSIVSLIPL